MVVLPTARVSFPGRNTRWIPVTEIQQNLKSTTVQTRQQVLREVLSSLAAIAVSSASGNYLHVNSMLWFLTMHDMRVTKRHHLMLLIRIPFVSCLNMHNAAVVLMSLSLQLDHCNVITVKCMAMCHHWTTGLDSHCQSELSPYWIQNEEPLL